MWMVRNGVYRDSGVDEWIALGVVDRRRDQSELVGATHLGMDLRLAQSPHSLVPL